MSAPQPAGDPVGSAAEEAVKLLRALATGAREAAHAEAVEDAGSHTCPNGWCPVCRVADWVHENPEVVDNLTDAAVGFARSVRDVLDAIVAVGDESRSEHREGAGSDNIADH